MKLVFLVHGMGVHIPKWSQDVQVKLNECAAQYAAFKNGPKLGDLVEFAEINYDSIFEHHVDAMGADTAALTAFAKQAGVTLTKVPAWLKKASPMEKGFFWTHVVDVLLYRYFALVRDNVRLQVMLQIAGKVAGSAQGGQVVNASVIAHSLGTSVVADSLALLGSKPFNGSDAFLAGKDLKFKSVFTIANVSKQLQHDVDPYASVLHPDSATMNPASEAYCARFYNFRHALDPFCALKPFSPAKWGDDFKSVDKLNHLRDFNVHGFEHYLDNPAVHIPIINGILEMPMITTRERLDAITRYARFKGPCIDALRTFSKGLDAGVAPTDVEEVVMQGAKFLALAQAAKAKCEELI